MNRVASDCEQTRAAASEPSAGNPFATRWTRPGAMPYFFAAGDSAAGVVDRLQAAGWRGQVVGPHGSGKSSLVAALAAELERRGRRVVSIALCDGQRTLGVDLRCATLPGVPTQIVVDGYEQLSRWSRWRLHACCRRRDWGLLVTTHRATGLATVAELAPSLALAQGLVSYLTASSPSPVAPADVAEAYAAHGGNLREMLFSLYDLHAARARPARSEAHPRKDRGGTPIQ